MVRVIKNNKYQSLQILLEDGEADPTFPANIGEVENTGISEAIVSEDLIALELIIKNKYETLNIKSVLVYKKNGKPRLIRPLHYLLKKIRKAKFQTQDKLPQLFIQSNLEVKEPEERDTMVKYLIKLSAYSPALTKAQNRYSRKMAIKFVQKILGDSFDPFTYRF
jgi:hypothetical protein